MLEVQKPNFEVMAKVTLSFCFKKLTNYKFSFVEETWFANFFIGLLLWAWEPAYEKGRGT